MTASMRMGLVCLVALVHATAYIVHQRPDWDVAWTDQVGYQRLGAVLAETGQFTRYPELPVFVPEVIRTPGYPAFVAAIYLVFGVGNHLAVAVAQAGVFAAICVMVYAIVRRLASERVAFGAALMTALFPPLPYFGALVLTELWTAFAATAAMLVCLRAAQDQRPRDFAIAGVLFGFATLVRPAFVLLPFFLAGGVPMLARTQRQRRPLMCWGLLALAAALTLAPWFAYNLRHLGQFTLSPAGGIGRGLWEGTWQGRWSGRTQSDLTSLAEAPTSDDALDATVREVAARTNDAPGLMLAYVHEWRDLHAMWDTPRDPVERAQARVRADGEYLRAALRHIKEDPLGHVIRRLTLGTFLLWAADIPIRYSLINETSTSAINAIWLIQGLLLLLAAVGVVSLARAGRRIEAVVLALPLVYVTGVHLPLLCEARQSLPVKPIMLALSAIGVAQIRRVTSPGTSGS